MIRVRVGGEPRGRRLSMSYVSCVTCPVSRVLCPVSRVLAGVLIGSVLGGAVPASAIPVRRPCVVCPCPVRCLCVVLFVPVSTCDWLLRTAVVQTSLAPGAPIALAVEAHGLFFTGKCGISPALRVVGKAWEGLGDTWARAGSGGSKSACGSCSATPVG